MNISYCKNTRAVITNIIVENHKIVEGIKKKTQCLMKAVENGACKYHLSLRKTLTSDK